MSSRRILTPQEKQQLIAQLAGLRSALALERKIDRDLAKLREQSGNRSFDRRAYRSLKG